MDRLYNQGINSVRGAAADAIAALLFADDSRAGRFASTVDRMVEDPSPAVRACVANILTAWLRVDRDEAVARFERLCRGAHVDLATVTVNQFLRYAVVTHYGRLRPLLLATLHGSGRQASAVATIIAIAGFGDKEAAADCNELLAEAEPIRVALAGVFAANVDRPQHRERCVQGLCRFFRDESDEVRKATAGCFWHLEQVDLTEVAGLIRDFCQTPAFETDPSQLMFLLENSTSLLPDVVCLALERFVEVVGLDASHLANAAAHEGWTVADLTIRLYTQSRDPNVRRRCLDLIDNMEERSFVGITDKLAATER